MLKILQRCVHSKAKRIVLALARFYIFGDFFSAIGLLVAIMSGIFLFGKLGLDADLEPAIEPLIEPSESQGVLEYGHIAPEMPDTLIMPKLIVLVEPTLQRLNATADTSFPDRPTITRCSEIKISYMDDFGRLLHEDSFAYKAPLEVLGTENPDLLGIPHLEINRLQSDVKSLSHRIQEFDKALNPDNKELFTILRLSDKINNLDNRQSDLTERISNNQYATDRANAQLEKRLDLLQYMVLGILMALVGGIITNYLFVRRRQPRANQAPPAETEQIIKLP